MTDLRARAKELIEELEEDFRPGWYDHNIGVILAAFEAIRAEQIEADARIAEMHDHRGDIATAIRQAGEKKG